LAAFFSARGLTVRYGPVTALETLDLDIARGEIFVLLGGSGSGKTTLLRCIAGFLAPNSGTLTLGGENITALPPHRRPVNTMFQSYALFPHMDVARNIAFGLRGMKRAERRDRVEQLLDLVRLAGFGSRRVTELSGGQQQRVALARALAPRPRLLLLDEPFSALDRGLREATRAEFFTLVRGVGTTAILVTHDQDEALATADRIGVLDAGRLAQVGTPMEIYERPASQFVARFLGAANVMEATVRESGTGGSVLDLPGGGALTSLMAGQAGTRVGVVVRPERLRLVAEATGPNFLAGVVERVSYHGHALNCAVRLCDGTVLVVSQPLTEGFTKPPAIGMAAVVAVPPDSCILLNA
jgi:ABC-type Fe3+/spermidine/putrescine transport system ATPase subunit